MHIEDFENLNPRVVSVISLRDAEGAQANIKYLGSDGTERTFLTGKYEYFSDCLHEAHLELQRKQLLSGYVIAMQVVQSTCGIKVLFSYYNATNCASVSETGYHATELRCLDEISMFLEREHTSLAYTMFLEEGYWIANITNQEGKVVSRKLAKTIHEAWRLISQELPQ